MALGLTQPLTEIVPGAFPGGKGGRSVRLTTLPPFCAVVMKSGNLNFLEPSGPLHACNGIALPFTFLLNSGDVKHMSLVLWNVTPYILVESYWVFKECTAASSLKTEGASSAEMSVYAKLHNLFPRRQYSLPQLFVRLKQFIAAAVRVCASFWLIHFLVRY